MKRKILGIAVSLALLSSLFVFAAPVGASPPQTLNGDWVGPPASPTNIWFADGNMFLTYTSETTLSGDIVGDMVSVG